MHLFVETLIEAFSSHQNPANALAMKAYMRHKFEYFGIKSPLRREISKPFFQKQYLPAYQEVFQIVEQLFNQPQRELHYVGIELMSKYSRFFKENDLLFFEKIILTKSWWDSVDTIASHWLAPYFLKFPEKRYDSSDKWIQSNELWLQRSALIFQLPYKKNTDAVLLFQNCNRLKSHSDFFIRKGIGWALRQYARTDVKAVLGFIQRNPDLSPLSQREAMKHL